VAWIKTIDAPESGSRLSEIYDEQRKQAGAVANILKVHGISPTVLLAHLEIYKVAMHTSGELSQRDREMIAVAVSRANKCEY
jgi:alkylhydroperoxidase family enzyme